MFLFQVETDGDAFANGGALREISKMLHDTARAIRDGSDTVHIVGTSRDTNGNTCGAFRYIPDTDTDTDADTAVCPDCGNGAAVSDIGATCAACGRGIITTDKGEK